jgi:hypothetical protein
VEWLWVLGAALLVFAVLLWVCSGRPPFDDDALLNPTPPGVYSEEDDRL